MWIARFPVQMLSYQSKVEQIEVISSLLFTLNTHKLQEHLVSQNHNTLQIHLYLQSVNVLTE